MFAELRARIAEVVGGNELRDREALLSLSHDGLSVKFLDEKAGEDFFSFAALEDLGFLPPLQWDGPNFTMRFSRDRILILSIGDNPLIYDREKFEAFIHRIFFELLNGVPVLLREAREPWKTAHLKVIGPGKLLIVGEEGEPVLSFSSVTEAKPGEDAVWRLEFYLPSGVRRFEVKIRDRRIRLFVLRYLQRFSQASWGYLVELSREFPQLERELRVPELEPVEREVLGALIAGVDPLDVPGVLRLDVVTVEKTYDSLIRKGLLRIRGIRKIVEPTPLAKKIKWEGDEE
ncbi:MAG: hypothetical protein J7K48_08295 [Thermococcus sp.]|nr:hypothetical protein [Thermococcus sp.]